jgi:hypothetical protein
MPPKYIFAEIERRAAKPCNYKLSFGAPRAGSRCGCSKGTHLL